MKILRTIEAARAASRQIRKGGKRLGLVPTMGALHEGHLSLVRAASAQADAVAVSIFVNPLQFGPHEDFKKYPRVFERDCQLLEAEGVALVFAPAVEEMYPPASGVAVGTSRTSIEVAGLAGKLEGKARPGHFRGVATVVAKLFHILEPDMAFFGQKDAQQVVILDRMVRDLSLPVEMVVGPIMREADGLAMSSRNAYLEPEQRKAATVLHRALMRVQTLADGGESSGERLAEAGREVIRQEPLARLDYLDVVDPETLDPVAKMSGGALVVVAAYLGQTRLIDNLLLG